MIRYGRDTRFKFQNTKSGSGGGELPQDRAGSDSFALRAHGCSGRVAGREVAIFSVFRHTAEHPVYRIEKRPKLHLRQGQYSVVAMDGRVLKRGADLKTVLAVLERKLIKAVKT